MARNYSAIGTPDNTRHDYTNLSLNSCLEEDKKDGDYGKGIWFYIPRDATLGGR